MAAQMSNPFPFTEPAFTRVSDALSVLALRTPTLPPATHTNTSFVGRERVWMVDPATPYPAERETLLAAARAVEAQGKRLEGLILTHHHPDHVGAAAWARKELGLPIWAHPRTAELLPGLGIEADHHLEEGAVVRGSERGDGDAWRVLHTPGHASGHIVLWEPKRGHMIVGDMVAAVGTILVEPPDGHMATYIAQLRRLAALSPTRLVPAHGAVIEDGVGHLEHYVAHRLAREAKVLDALEDQPRELLTITERSYPELEARFHPLAARSTLAHLLKLEEEGRASRTPEGAWRSGAERT